MRLNIWLILLCILIANSSYAQNLNWMLGKWDGFSTSNNTELIKSIIIDSVGGNDFSGTRSNALKSRNNIKIETAFSGYFDNNTITIKNVTVIYKKDPPGGAWVDCSDCNTENTVSIKDGRLVITSKIAGCKQACNGTSVYYKPMCSFDSSTQQYLVARFGKPGDLNDLAACNEKDTATIAAEKKHEQHIKDSVAAASAIALQREQLRIKDSVAAATAFAQKREKEIADSIGLAKKREQQIQDSTIAANKIALQKEQQRIKDSVAAATAFAKKREKEIADSIGLVKKREQQIQDSTIAAHKIALQKEQQRIKDSVAFAQKREKEIADSTSLAKKREQKVQDSIITANKIAQQKEQQRIKDSVAFAQKREKEIADSTSLAKKREQKVLDSITAANTIALQKEQQRIKDSVAAAATPAAKALATRDNVLLNTYHITTPDILIELFDNAQIDGDRVSVYHNGSLIVNNQTLLREPITIKIHADAEHPTHEFTMIAENLGKIPPNTALMRVTVGTQVYKLSVKTDMQTNAKIVFVYDGK